ncbi:hypothetical protein C8R46DRAFT_1024383 [Mycena filopes]|nr:hypothetical protein C8R46DRAFT_1024383 [Mycena filopes]
MANFKNSRSICAQIGSASHIANGGLATEVAGKCKRTRVEGTDKRNDESFGTAEMGNRYWTVAGKAGGSVDTAKILFLPRSPNLTALVLRTPAPTCGWFAAAAAGKTRKAEGDTLRGPQFKAPYPVRRLLIYPTSPASSSVSPIFVVDQRRKMAKLTPTLRPNVPPKLVLSIAQHRRGCRARPRSTSRRSEQHAHPPMHEAARHEPSSGGSTLRCVSALRRGRAGVLLCGQRAPVAACEYADVLALHSRPQQGCHLRRDHPRFAALTAVFLCADVARAQRVHQCHGTIG